MQVGQCYKCNKLVEQSNLGGVIYQRGFTIYFCDKCNLASIEEKEKDVQVQTNNQKTTKD